MGIWALFFLGTVGQLLVQVAESNPSGTTDTCKPVKVDFCRHMRYNTLHPNGKTRHNLDQLRRIVDLGCSAEATTFLCRVVSPECIPDKPSDLKPCQMLCMKVRRDCQPVLEGRGLSWPEELNCEQYPTCVNDQRFVPTAPSETCEPITVPLCKNQQYSHTKMPNILAHTGQEEAGLELHQFWPLVKVQCSPKLLPFLCSVYTPVCVSGKSLPPCKAICEEARAGCERLMNNFGFDWPTKMDCDLFTNESCEQFDVVSIPTRQESCELISVPMCQDLSYNQTTMPNTLGHRSQREVMVQIAALEPLVKSVCSADIRFLLCSVYTPQCVGDERLLPCRSFCEGVKLQCQSLLEKFSIPWPHQLTCDSFPEKSCISKDSNTEELTAEEVHSRLNKLGYYVQNQGISLQTARIFLAFKDKDKSGKLDVAEFYELERYVSNMKTEYLDSYELKNPGFVTKLQMKNALTVHDFILEDETFKVLWDRYTAGKGIRYDDFMAILTKLKILQDGLKSNLLSVPCECRGASFNFNQLVQVTLV